MLQHIYVTFDHIVLCSTVNYSVIEDAILNSTFFMKQFNMEAVSDSLIAIYSDRETVI